MLSYHSVETSRRTKPAFGSKDRQPFRFPPRNSTRLDQQRHGLTAAKATGSAYGFWITPSGIIGHEDATFQLHRIRITMRGLQRCEFVPPGDGKPLI
ncbi:hypothetical protein [Microvirga makkahensis]|uniref:Uncharacterized protein n=1 Tax=Microvirga makkahensis TaxID=1128670 RepID=A0A7X3MVQ7_9HYPH|nr:hypothetical protein [Microvirga makkahensis]MXQ14153.1 hypothetical protein [Microvirga makkahensis]